MMFAILGTRRWADTVWQKTRSVLNTERLSRWPGRLAASLPHLDARRSWAAVLASAVSADDSPAAEHQQRTARSVRPTALAAKTRDSSDGRAVGSPHARDVEGGQRGIGAAGAPRRRPLIAAQRAAQHDAPAIAELLRRYVDAGVVAAAPLDARPESAPPRGRHHEHAAVSRARREWANHASERVIRGLRVSLPPAMASRAAIDHSAMVVALVQAFDTSLHGITVDPAALSSTIQESEPRDRPDSTNTAQNARARRDESRTSFTAKETQPARVRRAPIEGDAERHPLTTAGDIGIDVEPLHPMGFSSPDSAPAPDVPISVTTAPARSISRVAPPTGAPSLPPLIPTAVTQPPAFGISAPSSRQATRAEDPGVDETEANILADRIRRILRDEGRRHGLAL